MKKILISALKYLFFISIGAFLFWLAVRNEDPALIMEVLKDASYSWLLLSVLVALIAHFFRALRWNLLIENMGYKAKADISFWAVMLGYFINMAVPRLGEVSRAGVAGKKYGIPFDKIMGTVVIERLFDLFVLIALTCIAIAFQYSFLKDFVNKNVLMPLSGQVSSIGTTIFLLFLLCIVLGIIMLIVLWKNKSRFSKYKIFAFYYRVQAGFIEGMKSIRKIKHKTLFVTYTLLIWAGYSGMIYFCFYCLDATSHLTFIDGITIMAIGSFGIVAPTPGGIGAYQFVVTMLLIEVYLMNSTIAVTFANISFFIQWIMMLVVGVIALLFLFVFNKKEPKNLKQE